MMMCLPGTWDDRFCHNALCIVFECWSLNVSVWGDHVFVHCGVLCANGQCSTFWSELYYLHLTTAAFLISLVFQQNTETLETDHIKIKALQCELRSSGHLF